MVVVPLPRRPPAPCPSSVQLGSVRAEAERLQQQNADLRHALDQRNEELGRLQVLRGGRGGDVGGVGGDGGWVGGGDVGGGVGGTWG